MRLGGERAVHELAQPRVQRRVHHDHHRDVQRLVADHLERDPVARHERLAVEETGEHVVVAAQRVEAEPLVVVQRAPRRAAASRSDTGPRRSSSRTGRSTPRWRSWPYRIPRTSLPACPAAGAHGSTVTARSPPSRARRGGPRRRPPPRAGSGACGVGRAGAGTPRWRPIARRKLSPVDRPDAADRERLHGHVVGREAVDAGRSLEPGQHDRAPRTGHGDGVPDRRRGVGRGVDHDVDADSAGRLAHAGDRVLALDVDRHVRPQLDGQRELVRVDRAPSGHADRAPRPPPGRRARRRARAGPDPAPRSLPPDGRPAVSRRPRRSRHRAG